jgi:hypothetical protein
MALVKKLTVYSSNCSIGEIISIGGKVATSIERFSLEGDQYQREKGIAIDE